MKLTTTLILPDVQHPYEDTLMMRKLVQVVKDHQPDQIVSIGDAIDLPQVSRWTKATAGEYAGTLQKDIDSFVSTVLRPLRDAAPGAKFSWVEGNHDLRIKDYLKKYAPAAANLRALEVPSLFSLDELDIEYVQGPHRIGTNVYAVHGHESGGYCASAAAWDLKFQKRYGSDKSIVFGHTHQGFLITRATGFKGKVQPRFTMNVGSIMDPNHATYVADGAVNWVMSFGFLRDDGKRVWPELVTATDRSFWFGSQKY